MDCFYVGNIIPNTFEKDFHIHGEKLMKRGAYICCNCNKAHYDEKSLKCVDNDLYVCKDEFACKGRFLNKHKKLKDFIKCK